VPAPLDNSRDDRSIHFQKSLELSRFNLPCSIKLRIAQTVLPFHWRIGCDRQPAWGFRHNSSQLPLKPIQ
jgi:hypothetical protein